MAIETETQKAAGRPKRSADTPQKAYAAPLLASQEFVKDEPFRIKMGHDTKAGLDLLCAYINKGKQPAEPGFTISQLIAFYASKDAGFAEYLAANKQAAMAALSKSSQDDEVDTHHASATRAA